MKKIILAVVLSVATTAAFAQLTTNNLGNSSTSSSSTSTSTSQQTSATLGSSDLLGTLEGSDTGTVPDSSSGTQITNPVTMPVLGHTGNLRQPGPIRK